MHTRCDTPKVGAGEKFTVCQLQLSLRVHSLIVASASSVAGLRLPSAVHTRAFTTPVANPFDWHRTSTFVSVQLSAPSGSFGMKSVPMPSLAESEIVDSASN